MGPAGTSAKPSVFINCPYDQDFEPLFLAIIFGVVCHGFEPRSAKESEGKARPRFERIVRALADSKYSIHDLSRFTGQGIDNLARFNMPLELGIAIGLYWRLPEAHNWLVLAPTGNQHQQFISDLAGFDVAKHESTIESIIGEVCIWLRQQPDGVIPRPTRTQVVGAFQAFDSEIQELRKDGWGKLIWADIVDAASKTMPRP